MFIEKNYSLSLLVIRKVAAEIINQINRYLDEKPVSDETAIFF
jgi:hypothetical protein